MPSTGSRRLVAPLSLAPVAVMATGCTMNAAPSTPFLGAYFPFWLLCVGAGVVGAVLVRVVFIRIGIDDGLPLRLFVYCCVAGIIGFTLALTLFGR